MLIIAVIIYVTVLVASGVEAWLFWKMHEEEKVYNRNAFVEQVPFILRASYSLFMFMGCGGFMLLVPFAVEEITSEGIWFGAIFTAIGFFIAIVLFFKMSVKITVNGNNATIKKPFCKEISFSFYDVARIICDHTFARNGKSSGYMLDIYTKEGLLITMNYKFVDCDYFLRKLKGYPHIMREDKY